MNLFERSIDIKKRLEKSGDEVEVDGVKTRELFGVDYTLLLSENKGVDKWPIPPASHQDMQERLDIHDLISEKEHYVAEDIHTRRVVLQPKYDFGSDLAACPSFAQFIIRNNKLYMFIVYRSMNFGRNFLFDNQTWLIYAKMAKDSVKEVLGVELEEAILNFRIVSLHRVVGDEVELDIPDEDSDMWQDVTDMVNAVGDMEYPVIDKENYDVSDN